MHRPFSADDAEYAKRLAAQDKTGAEEMQDLIFNMCSPARILDTIEELSRRWERASGHARGPDNNGTTFAAGRAEGYLQAIQLLLGVDHKRAKALLENGDWRG